MFVVISKYSIRWVSMRLQLVCASAPPGLGSEVPDRAKSSPIFLQQPTSAMTSSIGGSGPKTDIALSDRSGSAHHVYSIDAGFGANRSLFSPVQSADWPSATRL